MRFSIMIPFRYCVLKTDLKTKPLNEKVFEAITTDAFVVSHCDAARKAKETGDDAAYENNKGQLPMIFWCGFNKKGKREADALTPTQYYIMDIDHARMPAKEIWADIQSKFKPDEWGIRLAHETPSNGLRLVCEAIQDFDTIEAHQKWLAEKLDLGQYGDVDGVVKDLSRGSFMVKHDWILFLDKRIWTAGLRDYPILKTDGQSSDGQDMPKGKVMLPEITDEMRHFKLEGKLVSEIANEYIIDQGGIPAEGLRHAFYNDLVKNFRNICESDARIVFAVLPLCEGTPEKRWSQCTSICKSNNTSLIPKEFYLWLKKRGYKTSKKDKQMVEYMDSEDEQKTPIPALPPIFREFCSICPPDFVYPTIVALMPVMGTLTSYVRADYIDLTEQSTTFFSCIWAPPSCGKSFAKRLVDILMTKIKIRDEINNIREQLWLVDTRTKADDEKGQDLPHVMVRIMPAINSLPEFLEKMRDNRGYHMFTMAEEVDTFKKGSSSGGSDKSDLFRTAWDNSEYGQAFKSTGTFKGTVKVYYNILLTGTPGAVKKYYSNVEDGMVTRISICEIENQQFAKFQAWKPLTGKQREVIDRFVERCDANTYKDPIEMTEEDVHLYDNSSSNFDKNVKWRFNLKPKMKIDMSWLFPTILEWLEKTRKEASLANDAAADVFRRRCAVKGFRLGMVCYCCWPQPREREKKVIKGFIWWFMERDLSESLKMFGQKYNKLQGETVLETQRHTGLFEALSDEFTKNDVIAQCLKMNIKSKVKTILWRWKMDKAITKVGTDQYKKNKTNKV